MANDVRTGLKEEAFDMLSDEELVIAHLHGRIDAFEDLYDRYRDRLVHFVARKTGDGDQAQDLVQEAFIRVTRHLHRFDTSPQKLNEAHELRPELGFLMEHEVVHQSP